MPGIESRMMALILSATIQQKSYLLEHVETAFCRGWARACDIGTDTYAANGIKAGKGTLHPAVTLTV